MILLLILKLFNTFKHIQIYYLVNNIWMYSEKYGKLKTFANAKGPSLGTRVYPMEGP